MKFQTDNDFYNFRLGMFLISLLLVLLSISNLIASILFPTIFNSKNCVYINDTEVSYQ